MSGVRVRQLGDLHGRRLGDPRYNMDDAGVAPPYSKIREKRRDWSVKVPEWGSGEDIARSFFD